MSEAKTGTEIVQSFFETLDQQEGLDKDIVATLKNLYGQQKLTSTNILNELDTLRKKALNGEAQQD